eukprot:gnl/MRDRNA2_/MRDRNA2_58259_c0_seq2.p1 gnl/MRDRNA2_/MRDRNA2_58259_c0~~gnl/MRDRNA2_/MRDRNA2_58259_c0_seq2.p1  ORF type:complete len:703 (-),score=162.08 gnl/MRDRNA2_/MRDRNA2_58259_c0_seq2:368-2368(-)
MSQELSLTTEEIVSDVMTQVQVEPEAEPSDTSRSSEHTAQNGHERVTFKGDAPIKAEADVDRGRTRDKDKGERAIDKASDQRMTKSPPTHSMTQERSGTGISHVVKGKVKGKVDIALKDDGKVSPSQSRKMVTKDPQPDPSVKGRLPSKGEGKGQAATGVRAKDQQITSQSLQVITKEGGSTDPSNQAQGRERSGKGAHERAAFQVEGCTGAEVEAERMGKSEIVEESAYELEEGVSKAQSNLDEASDLQVMNRPVIQECNGADASQVAAQMNAEAKAEPISSGGSTSMGEGTGRVEKIPEKTEGDQHIGSQLPQLIANESGNADASSSRKDEQEEAASDVKTGTQAEPEATTGEEGRSTSEVGGKVKGETKAEEASDSQRLSEVEQAVIQKGNSGNASTSKIQVKAGAQAEQSGKGRATGKGEGKDKAKDQRIRSPRTAKASASTDTSDRVKEGEEKKELGSSKDEKKSDPGSARTKVFGPAKEPVAKANQGTRAAAKVPPFQVPSQQRSQNAESEASRRASRFFDSRSSSSSSLGSLSQDSLSLCKRATERFLQQSPRQQTEVINSARRNGETQTDEQSDAVQGYGAGHRAVGTADPSNMSPGQMKWPREPTDDEIRHLAYFLFEYDATRSAEDNWFLAREILQRQIVVETTFETPRLVCRAQL